MLSIKKHSWFSDCFINNESFSALKFEEREFSYYEIKLKILSVSNYFISKGISANQNVPVLFSSQYEFIITVYALWNIGAVPVLINNKLNKREITEQIHFVDSSILITDRTDSEFNNIGLIQFDCGTNQIIGGIKTPLNNKTALMIFTSGSSGTPKCVKLSFDNLLSSVIISNKQFHFLQNSKWIASLPFYHIGGFMVFFRALITNSTVVLLNELGSLQKKIETENPDYISLVPTQLKKLLNDEVKFNPNPKNIFLGGGPIDYDLLNIIIQYNLPVIPVYGSTETSSMISYQTFKELKNEKKIALLPFDGVEIKLVKESDKVGEIAVKSESLFSEYYKNKKETEARFNGDFYLTNDLGYFENGRLIIVGRKDEIILSGGENISGREIENEILKIDGVRKAVVIGVDDVKWGKAVAAVVETDLTENEIEVLLKEKLSSYKIPKIIKTTKQIPVNEMGKINRKKIEKILTN